MLTFPIYLDHNATTPCDPRVLESMLPYFTGKFGNAASRTHSFGWEASEAVTIAREQVAALIGAEPSEIVFTAGSTEGDNLALKGVFERYASKGNHIITVATEHNAVLDTCRHIERIGGEVDYLPVGSDGRIRLNEIEAAIKPSTILISIMLANNEIGVLQPVREISRLARERGVLFFSDATQAAGKIPIDVQEDGIDLMAFSAHKMYGPKGVGALYVRRKNPRVALTAQMDGGGHERGMRSGTLNVPGIVGFGKACEYARIEMATEAIRVAGLRDQLEEALTRLEETTVNGSRIHRLPNTTNISFKGVEAGSLLAGVNKELALSSGSACTSASPEPSHVLKALGLSDEGSHSSLRFSLGRSTTKEEIDYTIALVTKTVARLREESLLTR